MTDESKPNSRELGPTAAASPAYPAALSPGEEEWLRGPGNLGWIADLCRAYENRIRELKAKLRDERESRNMEREVVATFLRDNDRR